MQSVAPRQSEVTMLPEGSQTNFKKSQKVWYALWGAVPISSNSSEKIIVENELKAARVKTQISFVDFLIGSITGLVSIVPATMTVEGNHQGMQKAERDPSIEDGAEGDRSMEDGMEFETATALPNFRSAVPNMDNSTDEEILKMFRKKYPRLQAKSDEELIKLIEKKYSNSAE
jgi:hypothetical protein